MKGVRVWDVPLVRAELARPGLDWDAPASPPPRIDGPSQVRFIGGALVDPKVRTVVAFASGLAAPFVVARPGGGVDLTHTRSLLRLGLDGPAIRHLGRALPVSGRRPWPGR